MGADERVPLNGQERRAVEFLAAEDVTLRRYGEVMRARLKRIPNGWRQWRLASATIHRLLTDLYGTMTLKNLAHMQTVNDSCELIIRYRNVAPSPGRVVIDDDDIRKLINVAMTAECSICMRCGVEVGKCSLRRTLIDVAPAHKLDDGECPYQEVARASEYGHYV